MAIAVSISPVISNPDTTERELIVDGTIVLSGNYPANGDVLSFAGFDQIKSQSVPNKVEVYEAPAAGTAPTGYSYTYAPGETQALGQLVIMSAVATQFATGAYSGALTGATIKFRAWFPAFI